MNVKEIADRLFCAKRLRGDFFSASAKFNQCLDDLNGITFGTEQDSLRLAVCAPLRRLQQKTQVFPLDVKAASRNRLTHSLEVKSYSKIIVNNLVKQYTSCDLSPLLIPMINCVGNAALMHDIGNPPFGHFGESLIREWLNNIVEGHDCAQDLSDQEKHDLKTFNGNAQGVRLLHSIQDQNLTIGQYAAMIKVPFMVMELLLGKGKGAASNGIRKDYYSWSYANAGVFLSEFHLLEMIRENFQRTTRHPFATIIEYADDLAYVLADLEDAFDRGLISRDRIIKLCENVANLSELAELKHDLSPTLVSSMFSQRNEALLYLRSCVAHYYIRDLVQAICNNFDKYLETGEPDFQFGNYPGVVMVDMLKDFENKYIYNHYDVQTLDLSGAAYIRGLFSTYERLLNESSEDLKLELKAEGGDPFCMRIASRISKRQKQVYFDELERNSYSEIYNRIRLLVDYISGMTDTYAASEYRILKGVL
jgi:dGTPase